jgi:hypothetical protein
MRIRAGGAALSWLRLRNHKPYVAKSYRTLLDDVRFHEGLCQGIALMVEDDNRRGFRQVRERLSSQAAVN